MFAVPHPYPQGAAAAWIGRAVAGRDFAIELRANGDCVGAISLVPDEQQFRAELGYWIAPEHWGQGYATEAVRRVIGFGFDSLGLHRVHAECHADNPASRRVLEKAGMTLEGALREHSNRLGRITDKLQFGLLRSEWPRD